VLRGGPTIEIGERVVAAAALDDLAVQFGEPPDKSPTTELVAVGTRRQPLLADQDSSYPAKER
jgi:hypothetical protein